MRKSESQKRVNYNQTTVVLCANDPAILQKEKIIVTCAEKQREERKGEAKRGREGK